ncbi:hypothetical protein [Sphingomonas sp.]|uniref:hypothetical protein n=1 Tax=Sphingomonas sp. TaxID=28214 RepID=UPI0028AC871F|nr:hypothetical protein [Sphingomonas sp.]
MMGSILLAIAAFTFTENIPPAVDPLIAQIETDDADRFAALFERTNGRPTAAQLQHEYLDQGSYGIKVFTPNRIRDASYLASRIAAKPDLYARAIRTCLPIAKQTTSELRATYLAFHGLLPERALPRIYLVVGADNSGGTAGPGAQVLGLETLCRISEPPEQLRTILRGFYSHETVHVFQSGDDGEKGNALLRDVLTEGAADFIAMLVTGQQMDPARAAWAEPREAERWEQFQADLKTTAGLRRNEMKPGTPAAESVHRWVANYGSAPAGWPGEAGYWLGQRIWERWYSRQADKAAAIRAMLELRDPEAVLATGRFLK